MTTPIARAIDEHIRQHSGHGFTPGRYPGTYALDIARNFPAVIGLDPAAPMLSRAETSGLLASYATRTGQRLMDVRIALADAYLAYYHVEASQEDRAAAVRAYLEQYPAEEGR